MSVIIAKGVAQCCATAVGCGPVVPVSARTILIYPGQTEIVDEVPHSDYLAVKWLVDITAITTSNQRSLAYEMYAVHRYGTNPSYTLYSGVGNPLAQTPTVTIVGANMRFSVTNTSPNEVYLATITRIPIISSTVVLNLVSGAINPLSVPFYYGSLTIPASSSSIIDSLPFTRFTASKWYVKLTDTVTGVVRSFETYGNQRVTGVARHNLYSSLGTLNRFRVNSSMTGNVFELSVDNLRNNPIDVEFTRVPIVLDPSYLCCVCDCGSLDVIPINDVAIPASTTLTVDAVTVASVSSVKWLFVVRNSLTNEAQVYQVHATHDGTNVHYDVYGATGDAITLNINVTISGGSLNLDITNLEANTLNVNLSRIVVIP